MKAAFILAVAGYVAAQATAPEQSCQSLFDQCRQPAADGTSANQAECAAELAGCQADCEAQFDECRQPSADGTSANQAECAALRAGCLGEAPAQPSAPVTSTAPAYPSATPGNKQECDAAYDTCRVTPVQGGTSANQAACAAEYASCLGYNPFTNTASATPSVSVGEPVYRTETVTAFTTYCPSPSEYIPDEVKFGALLTVVSATFVHKSSTVVVTSATTLTLPCPTGCVVTHPVNPPATTPGQPKTTGGTQPPVYPTGPTGHHNATTAAGTPPAKTSPVVYTGAAAVYTGAPVLAAAGFAALFL